MFLTSLLTKWRLCSVLLLSLVAWSGTIGRATAQQLTFRSYDKDDGLTNAWFSCLDQNRAGYVFACTEHGVFVYDGRRFSNLGTRQGLPVGGVAISMVVAADGRLIIRYPHSIFVSTTPVGPHVSPLALTFQIASSEVGLIPDGGAGQMVPWQDGAVFAGQGQLYVIDPGAGTAKPVVRFATGSPSHTGGPLSELGALATSGSTLWAIRKDGSICAFGTASARCYGPSQGLPADNWIALLPMADQHVLARSPSRLADIDTGSGRVTVSVLPNQGARYDDYPGMLLLALAPGGDLVTQSANGLMIRDASGWKMLTTENGLPTAPILRLMFDHEGGLWLGVLGHGVSRALGYGTWEMFDHHSGLSSDVLWQEVRQQNGPLWVATDSGLDALGGPPGVVLAHRHYDKAGFSLALDRFGHLWRSAGENAFECITLSTGATVEYPFQRARQILQGDHDRLWFTTKSGVYVVNNPAVPEAPQPVAGLSGQLESAAVSPDGTLWVLRDQDLLHRHDDGQIVVLHPHWQQTEFEPQTLAVGPAGTVWVAGAGGGLYRLQLDGDRIVATTRFMPPDIISDSIVSLLVDSRGWLWVGTDSGISAYNGKRWVSATTNDGLIWDDQDEHGILEDANGSMWFASSQGLSHLLDPAKLFDTRTPRPVITSVTVGGAIYREQAVPYSRKPFIIEFGALDFRDDGAVRFRYRLDGVDEGWADTAIGYARYASVPPGHHRFELVAYNPLTHEGSAPVSILLRMQKPWWLWWPMLFTYAASAAAFVYGVLQLRVRFLLQRQRILEREVELRTAEIREAQATDSLTRLLTRGEAQARLTAKLVQPHRASQITIGLLDIDHFKKINDRYGHLVGDNTLQEIGRRLKLALQPGEYAGRYGGEEILIVIETDTACENDRITTLRNAVCGEPFAAGERTIDVTCSIGIAHDHLRDDWESLIGRADKALYRAKADGRDRIVVSTT